MWTPQKLFMYAMGGMPFCDKDIDNHCPWLLQWRHPRTNTPVKDYPMKDGAKPTAEEMKPYCEYLDEHWESLEKLGPHSIRICNCPERSMRDSAHLALTSAVFASSK